MSAKKFKFISPGVFLSEIDNSQLPKVPGGIGPVIIGRTRRGPALKPVKVSSFQEFVEVFGDPVPGNEGEDPWRDGNGLLATAYAPYAAQAYLRADIDSPVTVIRLLGVAGDDADDTAKGHPGWDVEQAFGIFAAPGRGAAAPENAPTAVTASLIGIIYSDEADIGVGVGGPRHGITAETLTAVANRASGSATTVKAVDIVNDAFSIAVSSSTQQLSKTVSLRTGPRYIRDVLNTSPVATNNLISTPPSGTLADKYWLGETFEETYEEVKRATGTNNPMVFVAKLHANMNDFRSLDHSVQPASSGWVVPQHVGSSATFNVLQLEKLFRFHTVQEGEQGLDLYICIENIKVAETGDPNPFGRFDVVVKQRRGGRIYVIDSFENLNLNPNSDNFIARRIGDQYFEWDASQKRNKVYGNYPNRSSYIRVEMSEDVGERGPDNPKSVPFGYLGPIKPTDVVETTANTHTLSNDKWVEKTIVNISGSTHLRLQWPTTPHVTTGSKGVDLAAKYVLGSTPYNRALDTNNINYSSVNYGMKDYLRRFSSFGSVLSSHKTGIATGESKHGYLFSLDDVVLSGTQAPTDDLSQYNPTAVDFVAGSHVGKFAIGKITITGNPADGENLTIRDVAGNALVYTAAAATNVGNRQYIRTGTTTEVATALKSCIESDASGHGGTISVAQAANVLTLTQKVAGQPANPAISLAGGANHTVEAFAGGVAPTAYTALSTGGGPLELLRVVDSFAMPLVGGFDGVDVTEADPFNMSNRAIGIDSTTRNSYAHASVDRALELIRDPEALEMNLAAMPGITNKTLTTKLVQVCEARADALAVIDLPDVYIPPAQAKCNNFKDRVDNTTPEKSAKNLIARQINSSYGATYYPWVKVRDTISARDVWVPPSVVALGVMGYTEQRDEVWFAPAGFNRGGLNEGNAGLPVLQVSEQLLSSQRDRLYEANINPIASFVSEGLVVFGQKTLQMTPSALDRINVRRLLIFVKKEISRIANGLLFDQNVPATWNRFTGQVVPFLEGVKTRLGLTDFKVVLDKTTTTPDLVDRNIMYAKIFLKPARAIEFIAVDFVITRTGASFDD